MIAAQIERIRGRGRRLVSGLFSRRPFQLELERPLVSFTFDDFPVSALWNAGEILLRHETVGTYYAAFGLMGKSEATGRIFEREDLDALLEKGHDLGCHTFDHFPAWSTGARDFEESVLRNREALERLAAGNVLRTSSYPIQQPRPGNKSVVERHFECARAGGQTNNTGTIDLNALAGYFIDARNRDNPQAMDEVIARNAKECGWLIFATHDVCPDPTPYGCEEKLFEHLVESSLQSGADVVSVSEAWDRIRGDRNSIEEPEV